MAYILIIEDEKSIAQLLKYALEKEGFEVQTAACGAEGLEKISLRQPQLILLDLMLPDMDGLDICRQVTAQRNIPIIILSAKSDQVDKLIGLEYGADDYITKPFDIREVILRIRSVIRRISHVGEVQDGRLSHGDLVMDLGEHRVKKGGAVIDLTPKEFDLLKALLVSKGKVMSRSQLLTEVWEFEYMGDTRTVDIHIQRLRRKLGDDKFITTVFGVGYKIAGEE
ncbi:MAG: response regulator transcription factor [Christensenellaceae bacterium]|nr:response regulator transcription factor [Christensenellaceae bacterium]